MLWIVLQSSVNWSVNLKLESTNVSEDIKILVLS